MILFLNKIHYGLFHFQLAMDSKLNSILLKITPKKKERVVQAKINETESFMESFHMGLVNHFFGYCYSGYFLFFSFILLGIKDVFFDIDNEIVTLLLMGLPVLVGYIPAYKAVLSNDVYLKYYKKFEKKDARWQRKCKWMAVAFCIGGFLTTILGLFAYAFIWEYAKS